jgi:hypothetical protein
MHTPRNGENGWKGRIYVKTTRTNARTTHTGALNKATLNATACMEEITHGKGKVKISLLQAMEAHRVARG